MALLLDVIIRVSTGGRPQVERMPLGIDTATELCDISETVGISIQIGGTNTSWAD